MEEKYLLHLFFFFYLQFENRLHHWIFTGEALAPISWAVVALRAQPESQSPRQEEGGHTFA